MEKISLNDNWKFVKGYVPSLRVLSMYGKEAQNVNLPHDAMVHEKRDANTANGGATGFYPGGIYTYFKSIEAPAQWQGKSIIIEFEGVYESAMVYVNGTLVKTNDYGYSNFYVEISGYLNYGVENEIKVIADNSNEKNSRWYSGSGIYRDVNLYICDKVCIPINGVTATTKLAQTEVAVVEWKTILKNTSHETYPLYVKISMADDFGKIYCDTVHVTSFSNSTNDIYQSITIKNPKLWSTDNPNLYNCKIEIINEVGNTIDEQFIKFGIRVVTIDAVYGLRINWEQIKLRGTCIHHDNGILGAATYRAAEYRKCKLIKDAGFNAIRSAHHPAGKALLDACDEYGILVMDELTDMWTVHKNEHDFADKFINEWQDIASAMITKDYNHPSVILYSVGNEISEIGTPRGANLNRTICNYFKEKDSTRFTTNGINALNAAGAKMYPIMQELAPLIQADSASTGTNDTSGSNAINSAMKLMEGKAGEAFSVHPIITSVIQESTESMDIIGLNYLTGRHLLENELHPNKCVLGTETFPADIARLWRVVNASNQVLGDFTWTGYDYLGEAGCGIFYYDGKANFGSNYPDRAAYIGDMDLIGTRRPISYLREIVYGLRKTPYIAVERVDKVGKTYSKTPWMLKDNISSWTWYGYEGTMTTVDVYSPSEKVELFLNNTSLGVVNVNKETFTASFKVEYQPGVLKAVGYTQGVTDGEFVLKTALQSTQPMFDIFKADESISFVTISFADGNNVCNYQQEHEVYIKVDNGVLLGFGSANPSSEGNYFDNVATTFDGKIMAVIMAVDGNLAVGIELVVDGKDEARCSI
jgi:hypothetical protein